MCLISDILQTESKIQVENVNNNNEEIKLSIKERKKEERKQKEREEGYFSVTGVDISEDRLGICKTLTKKYELKNCRLVSGDGATFCESAPHFENVSSFCEAMICAQKISEKIKKTDSKKLKQKFLFCNSFPLLFSSPLHLTFNQDQENLKYDKIIVDVNFLKKVLFFLYFKTI